MKIHTRGFVLGLLAVFGLAVFSVRADKDMFIDLSEGPDAYNIINDINRDPIDVLPYFMDFGSAVPDGWQNIDVSGSGYLWEFRTAAFDLGAGDYYAIIDSDRAGTGPDVAADLVSPVFDLTDYEDGVEISFIHYYNHIGNSSAELLYSIDDGVNWGVIESWDADTEVGEMFSAVVEEVGGHSSVLFAWSYDDGGSWAWYWAVDHIRIASLQDATIEAHDAAFTVAEGWTRNGAVTATHSQGSPLTFALETGPQRGTLVFNADGSYGYTAHRQPWDGFVGSDSFTFRASDGAADSNEATVTITITPVNDAPVAQDSAFVVSEGATHAGAVSATDVDGDALMFAVVDAPAYGTLVFNADGSFSYEAHVQSSFGFVDSDRFTFLANDGLADSNHGTVTITIVEIPKSRRPVFSWNPVTGATWYQLWVSRDGQAYATPWVQGATEWLPALNGLPGGEYRWWVRAWVPEMGITDWVEYDALTIEVDTPGAISLITPEGMQVGHDLDYRWERDEHATWYRLWVGNVGAGGWYDGWHAFSGTGTAEVELAGHPAGDFTWWIHPWGPDGFGPWSGPLSFSTPDPAPAQPTLISPVGETTSPVTLEYESDRAEWFRVFVSRDGATVYDGWTQSTTVDLGALHVGDYALWLGAWNAAGGRVIWSDRKDFTVQ